MSILDHAVDVRDDHGGERHRDRSTAPAPCGSASATERSSPSTSTRSCGPSPAAPTGPRRASTRCGSPPAPSPASSTAPPPRSSTSCPSAPRPRSSPRSRTTPGSPPACSPPSSTRRCRTRTSTPSASRSPPATRQGIIGDEHRGAGRHTTPASSTTPSLRRAQLALRVLRPAHRLRPLPAAPPRDPPGHRDAAVLLHARRLRPVRPRPRRPSSFYGLISSLEYLPSSPDAVQLRHHAPADVALLPARLARGQPRRHLRPLHATSPGSPSSPAASASSYSRIRSPGLADPRHQRPVQRHRAVAQDARLVGRRGQPGRQAQGRGLRLPRDVARRHRGVPRAARQHRRRRPAAPTTSTSPTGSPTCSWSGSRRTGSGRCSTPRRSRTSSTSTATSSSGPTSRPRADGLYERQVPARQLYTRMMRTLAQTGNGWMTFKDASNTQVQPDRQHAADGTADVVHLSNLCTEILEVTNQAETAVCNLGSINLGAMAASDDGARRSTSTASAEVVRTAVPFLDRVIDINYYPTDAGRQLQRPVAPGRPRAHGPAGRVLQAAPAVRLAPRPASCPRRISEEIYFHALWASTELAEAAGPHDGLRRDPRRQGRAAVRPVGRHARPTRPAGSRCASASPRTACATRC